MRWIRPRSTSYRSHWDVLEAEETGIACAICGRDIWSDEEIEWRENDICHAECVNDETK